MHENLAQGPDSQERETRIDNLAKQVSTCIERIGKSTDDLESFTDRLVGPIPEEASNPQIHPCSSGKIGTIEDQTNRLETLSYRLEELYSRLYEAA